MTERRVFHRGAGELGTAFLASDDFIVRTCIGAAGLCDVLVYRFCRFMRSSNLDDYLQKAAAAGSFKKISAIDGEVAAK